MLTSTQLRAARALLGIDQRTLAAKAGVSVPTIQRMEASEGVVRGVVESLAKVVDALDQAGVEFIYDGAVSSQGGRGVRLKVTEPRLTDPDTSDETADRGRRSRRLSTKAGGNDEDKND